MSKQRELTIDELDAVSGGAGAVVSTTCADILGCALIGLLEGGLPTSGGGLVHEPIHAK
jgi:bacteriocin-like protein